jgi:hypothetical protein
MFNNESKRFSQWKGVFWEISIMKNLKFLSLSLSFTYLQRLSVESDTMKPTIVCNVLTPNEHISHNSLSRMSGIVYFFE